MSSVTYTDTCGDIVMSSSERPAASAPAFSSAIAASIRDGARKMGSQPSAISPVSLRLGGLSDAM